MSDYFNVFTVQQANTAYYTNQNQTMCKLTANNRCKKFYLKQNF